MDVVFVAGLWACYPSKIHPKCQASQHLGNTQSLKLIVTFVSQSWFLYPSELLVVSPPVFVSLGKSRPLLLTH